MRKTTSDIVLNKETEIEKQEDGSGSVEIGPGVTVSFTAEALEANTVEVAVHDDSEDAGEKAEAGEDQQ